MCCTSVWLLPALSEQSSAKLAADKSDAATNMLPWTLYLDRYKRIGSANETKICKFDTNTTPYIYMRPHWLKTFHQLIMSKQSMCSICSLGKKSQTGEESELEECTDDDDRWTWSILKNDSRSLIKQYKDVSANCHLVTTCIHILRREAEVEGTSI